MRKFCRLCKGERLELLGAYTAGKKIQYKIRVEGPWIDTEDPSFCDFAYYRIAPDDLCFGKLDRLEQLEIIKAYLDDKIVQVRFCVVGEWFTLAKLDKSADINLPFKFTNYYRIKK